jgi:histidyl-tRNA synthetase
MAEVFAALPIPRAVISVNNRKLAEAFYRGVGAEDPGVVLRAIDKLDKIGPAKVSALLQSDAGLTAAAANACLALADIRTSDLSFVDRVHALGVHNDLLDEGLSELSAVISGVQRESKTAVVANLRIARGLDYYTGTVYETELVGHESVGSICSGGRYDTLASAGNRVFPGVGISLGVTRLVSILLGRGLVTVSRSVPSAVLVAVNDEDGRGASAAVASTLRARGIPCEVAAHPDKFGKQIRYAERRGIPYVWFLTDNGGEIKDIRNGDQAPADPATWVIPEDDRVTQVISTVSEEDS